MNFTVALFCLECSNNIRLVCNIDTEVGFEMKKKNWSKKVTEQSNALDLEEGIFTWDDPKKIAMSLKKSALKSHRIKGTCYQSAMSMLNFYINRAGKNLTDSQKNILEKSKHELSLLFQKKDEVKDKNKVR